MWTLLLVAVRVTCTATSRCVRGRRCRPARSRTASRAPPTTRRSNDPDFLEAREARVLEFMQGWPELLQAARERTQAIALRDGETVTDSDELERFIVRDWAAFMQAARERAQVTTVQQQTSALRQVQDGQVTTVQPQASALHQVQDGEDGERSSEGRGPGGSAATC